MSIRTGFHPLRHTGGRPYAGGENRYYVPASDATALFLGDPVKLANGADTAGVPAVTKASPGEPVVGFVAGFERDHSNIDAAYRLASTARYVSVVDDPAVTVSAIDTAGDLTLADCGKFIGFADAGGNTTTGVSGAYLDAGTLSTTSGQLRLVSLLRKPDAATGANAVWECAVMWHENAAQAVVPGAYASRTIDPRLDVQPIWIADCGQETYYGNYYGTTFTRSPGTNTSAPGTCPLNGETWYQLATPSSGSSGSTRLDIAWSRDIDLSGAVALVIEAWSPQTTQAFTLFVSDTNFTNYKTFNLGGGVNNGVPNTMIIPVSYLSDSGTPPMSAIRKIRFSINYSAGTVNDLWIKRIGFIDAANAAKRTPPIVFLVDDGAADNRYSSTAGGGWAQIFEKYGLVGSFGVITEIVDGTDSDWMRASDLRILDKSGHEIAIHDGAYWCNDFATQAELYAHLTSELDQIEAYGVPRPVTAPWPYGNYTASGSVTDWERTTAALAQAGIVVARTTNPNVIVGSNRHGCFAPWAGSLQEPHLLPMFDLGAKTSSQIIAAFDLAVSLGLPLVCMGHYLVSSGATGLNTNVSDLDTACADLRSKIDAGTVWNPTFKGLAQAMGLL